MVLGIDLGTTYSAAAYIDKERNVQMINNSEGNKLTPSVVLFDRENEIIVGEVAKENSMIRSQDVVVAVKNYMGKKIILKSYGENHYNPEMISSFIIRKIVRDASNEIGEDIKNVVITVPAYFNDAQRKATEDAATIAGVHLIGMINEPTAAALCYTKKYDIHDKNLLIYDLGGGTFDVTILKVKDCDNIEVKSTGGLSNTGGRFFDQYIVDYVRDYIEKKYSIDLEDDEYADDLQELYVKAENAKIQLSSKKSVNIILKIGKIKEQVEIKRELFESMINKLYVRTESKIRDVLKSADMTVSDIDKVLLVGGSSRIPYVIENIKKLVGIEPSREINPDEAVAIGAAIYGSICEQNKDAVGFTDVCSHSIGIVVVNNAYEEENEIILRRNTSLPVENEQRFRTIVEGQRKIDLTITEGEYKELTDVTIIGNFEIFLPPGLSANALVLLKIALDKRQLIHVNISLPDINFEQEYNLKRIANLDEEAVKNITGLLRDYEIS